MRNADDLVTPPPTRWLAPRWMPAGRSPISTATRGSASPRWWVWLAAAVTTGRKLEVIGLPSREPADIVLVLTEDSWDEVKARLTLAGADTSRVHVFSEEPDGTGCPSFPDDMPALTSFLDHHPAAAGHRRSAWLDTVDSQFKVKDPQDARRPWRPGPRWQPSTAWQSCCSGTPTGPGGTLRERMGATVELRKKARMVLYAGASNSDRGKRMAIGPEKANGAPRRCAGVHSRGRGGAHADTRRPTAPRCGSEIPATSGWSSTRFVAEWAAVEAKAKRASTRGPTADERTDGWLWGFFADRPGGASE